MEVCYCMFEVTIKINVKNHSELLKKYSEELKNDNIAIVSINEKVEREVKRQIEIELDESIKKEFIKNNVKAKILIK